MNNTWPEVKLGEVLQQRPPDVKVDAAKSYQFAGVYSFGRGVFKSRVRLGTEFAYPKLTQLRVGEFVYPKLMAWEGAFGVVPRECDGCYVSPEFPVFGIDKTRVLPEFLSLYFQSAAVWNALSGGSVGTNVRRRRLHPSKLMAHAVPLPPIDAQSSLVQRTDAILSLVREAAKLREEAKNEVENLWPAIASQVLSSAFSPGTWKGYQVKDFTKRLKRVTTIDARTEYRTIGVKWWGKGVYAREPRIGASIKAKRMFSVCAADLIYNNMWARHGSVGIVPPELSGSVVTSDFPVFEIDQSLVNPAFLALFTRLPAFWELCEASSYGTSDRRRIDPTEFLHLRLAFPVLAEQRRIVEELESLQRELDSVKNLQTETAAELDALLPAILDRALKGDL